MARSLVIVFAALVAGMVIACGDGTTGASTSGGVCAGTAPSSGSLSAACASCENASCASAYAGQTSACSPWLTCLQACSCTDSSCIDGCAATIDVTCAPAKTALSTCAQSSCASACAAAPSDAGPQATSCAKLATCCPTILGGASAIAGCNAVVALNADATCATQLANYQSNGECVGPVDAGALTPTCASLGACCATLTNAGAQAACTQVADLDGDVACQIALTGYLEAGTCD